MSNAQHTPGPYSALSDDELRRAAVADTAGVFAEKTERNQRVQAGREVIRRMHERAAIAAAKGGAA